MEYSLENRLRMFQDKLLPLLHPEKQTEPDQSRVFSSGFFSANLLSPEEPHQQWTESLMSHKSNDACWSEQDLNQEGGFTTDLSPTLINDLQQQWAASLMSYKSDGESRLEQDLSLTEGFTIDLSLSLVNDTYQQWTKSLISYKSDDECRLEQDLSQTGGSTTDLSPWLINDPHQQWAESLMSGVLSTVKDLSLNQNQSKFTIFLYNQANDSFPQLGDSVSSFDQLTPPNNLSINSVPDNLTMALLGTQGFGLKSSNNIDLPPQMQTQNPLVHFDQFAMWNQTPSFGDAMMPSSNS